MAGEAEASTERAGEGASVVVVGADAARLGQYGAAFRMAQIPALVTLDADEAEAALGQAPPSVLVLDRGLPRMVLFRLYGAVRSEELGSRVRVVFVGQDGDTGPEDHYVPGDPSPLTVAAQVSDLVADPSADPATDWVAAPPESQSAGEAATADSTEAGVTPSPTVTDASVSELDDAETSPTAPSDGQPAEAVAYAGATGTGVSAGPDADRPAREPASDASAHPAGQEVEPESAPTSRTPEPAPVAAATERPRGRRLDVILFRLGLAFLIVGAILFFLQGSASLPWPLSAPTMAPAVPTQQPAASPSPAAWLDGGMIASVEIAFGR